MTSILKIELTFHYEENFIFSISCLDIRNSAWTEFWSCNIPWVQQKFLAFFKLAIT